MSALTTPVECRVHPGILLCKGNIMKRTSLCIALAAFALAACDNRPATTPVVVTPAAPTASPTVVTPSPPTTVVTPAPADAAAASKAANDAKDAARDANKDSTAAKAAAEKAVDAANEPAKKK